MKVYEDAEKCLGPSEREDTDTLTYGILPLFTTTMVCYLQPRRNPSRLHLLRKSLNSNPEILPPHQPSPILLSHSRGRPLDTIRLPRLAQTLPSDNDRIRRVFAHFLSYLQTRLDGGWRNAVDQSVVQRFLGGHSAGCQSELRGKGVSDDFDDAGESTGCGVETDADFREAELGGWGCYDHVAAIVSRNTPDT